MINYPCFRCIGECYIYMTDANLPNQRDEADSLWCIGSRCYFGQNSTHHRQAGQVFFDEWRFNITVEGHV